MPEGRGPTDGMLGGQAAGYSRPTRRAAYHCGPRRPGGVDDEADEEFAELLGGSHVLAAVECRMKLNDCFNDEDSLK
jgi:hypothetical protein